MKIINLKKELVNYVDNVIIPIYNNTECIDKAHKEKHIRNVIKNSMYLSKHYDVDINVVYAIASLHDIGLTKGNRDTHHIDSYNWVIEHKNDLSKFFNNEEIDLIAISCKEHRASNKEDPTSIYGEIVSDADRCIEFNVLLKRSLAFNIKTNKYYLTDEEIKSIEKNVYEHLIDKYAEGSGYLKLYLPESLELYGDELVKVNNAIKLEFEEFKEKYLDEMI